MMSVWPTPIAVRTDRFVSRAELPAAITVRVAGALVTLPAEFDATTVYSPASVDWTAGNTSELLVAPAIGVPLRRH